ncbi:MAG: N-acetylneuraminate synthase [Parcubacteria group bacterium Greene0416_79]|nr:MAG: N-acetylneuraminate synthase [Parcubacteria group bacterium Greene0416_79]
MLICEIGHNHLGDLAYVDEYVGALLEAAPDAVTFQYREPARYHGEDARLRLPDATFSKARLRFQERGIRFGVAIGEESKIGFFESIGVDFYKVLSKDLANTSLITMVARTQKPFSISTGLSDLGEIDRTVSWAKKKGFTFSLIHTTLTHRPDDVNLKAIPALRERYGVPVAFGSHATNYHVLYAALGFEPSDIFFYVKGNRPGKHSDGDHSVPLAKLKEVIANLRELSVMIGSGTKFKTANLIRKEG